MSKHSLEVKLKAVEYYLSNSEGYRAVSKRFLVDASTLRFWVALYEHHGPEGLVSVRRGPYTAAFKKTVLDYRLQHRISARETAAHFKLPTATTIVKWKSLYNDEEFTHSLKTGERMLKKPLSVASKEMDDSKSHKELMEELTYLRAENAYLKKLKALIQEKEQAEKKKRK